MSPDEGMILRETVAKHPLLSQTAIIKAGTGEDRFSAYCDLWNSPSRKKLALPLSIS